MKNIINTALLLCFGTVTVVAQQLPLNSSTYFMRGLYNPALTAYNGSTNVYGYFRDQWTGLPGHPITMGGYGELSVWKDKAGVGVQVSNDVTSIIRNVSAQLSYTQKIRLAKNHYLSLGLSAGLLNTYVDYANAKATDMNDPNMFTTSKSGLGFDMNAGLAYQWKKLTVGVSVPHIANTNSKLTDQLKNSSYKSARNFMAHASYEFSFKQEKWNVEPSIMFKKGTNAIYQIDGNVTANYKRFLYLGIGYRQDYGLSGLLGVRISQCVTLAYSYEFPIISGANYGNTNGTHEVLFGINFDKWLKKPADDKLKKDFAQLVQKVDNIEKVDTAMAKKVDSLDQANKQLAQKNDDIQNEKKTQDEQIAALKAQMESLEKQVAEYKEKVGDKKVPNFSNLEGTGTTTTKVRRKDANGKDVKDAKGNYVYDNKTITNMDGSIKEGDILKLDKVYFAANSSYMKSESFNQLDQLAEMLKSNPNLKVKVLGHTDFTASEIYNMWLSDRRAKRVADYLINKGVEAANVSSVGFGMKLPIADNNTVDGRTQNRRVEIQVIDKK